MPHSTSELADILKRRQIKRVCYFHTDHFEPWSSGLNEKTALGVERFGEMSRASRFGRKMSLFYSAFVPHALDVEGSRSQSKRVKGDAIVFNPRSAAQEKLAERVIRPLNAPNAHEFHLHVHHEFWTRNESKFDHPVSRWVNENSTAELDEARLNLFFQLCNEAIGRELGTSFDRWAFIHGNWALAASDPQICTIDNELSLIMRHGGFGDFSFPAGRGICDPKLETPFTCLPLEMKRPYDDPASDPRPLGAGRGALRPERFFIWNSPIKARFSSLDYYSESNRRLFKEPSRVVVEWLNSCVAFGSDLFVKTHAHSMKWEYDIGKPDALIPHCYPDVVKVFEQLMQACDLADVEFQLLTVNEVMGILSSFDAPAARKGEPKQTPRHRIEPPTARRKPGAAKRELREIGAVGGARKSPPAEAQATGRPKASAAPNKRRLGAVPSKTRVEKTLELALPLPESGALSIQEEGLVPIDTQSFSDEFLQLQRDWSVGEGGLQQDDDLYASKLKRSVSLENYELAVAAAIAERFDTKTEIVEIGCGYGALALLLAHRGFIVHGFEGDRRRSTAAAWHLQKYGTRHPEVAARATVTPGFFPDVAQPSLIHARVKGRKRIALATNITCTYTATHHDAILEALRVGFDELVLDLSRFGLTRNTQEERDALRDLLAHSGYEPVERLHTATPYEYWRFRIVPRAKAETIPRVSGQQSTTEASFPLITPKGETLYTVFGDRNIEACPVCHGHNSVHLWRMPMTSIKEPISLFGGYFNQVPTLQVPATVFCFDFCHDCESIYLNPAPAAQKEQYRKTDHYIRTMQADNLWQQYESSFDRFAKWIPDGATTMMDAACGIGPYLEVARRREPTRWKRLIGLELAEKYVAYMQDKGFEAHAFDIDNDDLIGLLGADSADFIAFCEAFEHVERPLDALSKLLSVLKPGGRMFFTAQRYGRDVQAAVRPGEPIYIGEKVLKELPEQLGCQVVDVTTSGMRYYVVLEK